MAANTTVTQQRTARVLTTILGSGLAPACWSVDTIVPHELSGMLERDDRTGLKQWAEAFGAPIDWHRHDGRRPEVAFTVNGVRVRVWTLLTD